MHIVHRALFAKEVDGDKVKTPDFDSKNAVGSNWDEMEQFN